MVFLKILLKNYRYYQWLNMYLLKNIKLSKNQLKNILKLQVYIERLDLALKFGSTASTNWIVIVIFIKFLSENSIEFWKLIKFLEKNKKHFFSNKILFSIKKCIFPIFYVILYFQGKTNILHKN